MRFDCVPAIILQPVKNAEQFNFFYYDSNFLMYTGDVFKQAHFSPTVR